MGGGPPEGVRNLVNRVVGPLRAAEHLHVIGVPESLCINLSASNTSRRKVTSRNA
jgi:hypothetical protein